MKLITAISQGVCAGIGIDLRPPGILFASADGAIAMVAIAFMAGMAGYYLLGFLVMAFYPNLWDRWQEAKRQRERERNERLRTCFGLIGMVLSLLLGRR